MPQLNDYKEPSISTFNNPDTKFRLAMLYVSRVIDKHQLPSWPWLRKMLTSIF